MKYATPVWDPYYNTDIYMLEKVQKELLDGSYLNTREIPVLCHYCPFLIYLRTLQQH